jgi:hypothetical protein
MRYLGRAQPGQVAADAGEAGASSLKPFLMIRPEFHAAQPFPQQRVGAGVVAGVTTSPARRQGPSAGFANGEAGPPARVCAQHF